MRNGYFVDTSTTVDLQEIVKTGGKVVEISEGVICQETFEVSPFKKSSSLVILLRQRYKNVINDVMQLLVKLIMNSLYGEQIRKYIEDRYECKSENWTLTEYDERVSEYQKINFGIYIVKMKDDAGLQDEVKKVNTMPPHLSAFVISNSKRTMNKCIHAINEFYTNDVYYTDTDRLYIEHKHWNKLDKAGLIGKNRIQCKNDYSQGGIWHGLYLALKIKYSLTIKKIVIMDEKNTFKGFNSATEKLDRKEFFNMADGDKLIAKLPLSWKKTFCQGVVMSPKLEISGDCKKILCLECGNLVNRRKEFWANIIEKMTTS